MTLWSCATCGIEYADTPEPPAVCPICSDERQYLLPGGQKWTTQAEIAPGRSARVNQLEPGLYEIAVSPKFGIGHRSLFVQTPNGNLLWDVSGFYDDALIASLQELGGVAAIASSHPHLTGAQVSVSHRFGGVPIYWGEDDQRWIQRPDDVITLWSGTHEVLPGLTLVQCGGHFAGSSVLHFTAADGHGVLLAGDTVRVNADRKTVSFMRSYPNLIPLSPRSLNKIVDALAPWSFDRIHGGFDGELFPTGAAEAVRASAKRYIGWVNDELQDEDERR